MSNLIPGNQKHLTLNDRLYIEHALDEGRSFRDIAKYLCKDPTMISREVRLHRSLDTWHKGSFNNPYNFCIHRFKCRKTNVCKKLLICDQKCASCHKCNQVCDRFEKEACRHLDKAPFVCNGFAEGNLIYRSDSMGCSPDCKSHEFLCAHKPRGSHAIPAGIKKIRPRDTRGLADQIHPAR